VRDHQERVIWRSTWMRSEGACRTRPRAVSHSVFDGVRTTQRPGAVGAGPAGAGELAASVESTMEPVTVLRRVCACERRRRRKVDSKQTAGRRARRAVYGASWEEGRGRGLSEMDGPGQRQGASRRTSPSSASSETGVLARMAGSWSSNEQGDLAVRKRPEPRDLIIF